MAPQAFAWSAFLALTCGFVAGLGALYSAKRAFALAFALWVIQTIAWMMVFRDVALGFFASLLVVAPYTVIGAVISGGGAGWWGRKAR